MTLVLSCFTPDFAIQVSDRRTTYRDGTVHSDERNKGTAFDGRYAIAYSGPAEITGMAADIWLSIVLAQGPSDDPFMHVANSAQEAIRAAPANSEKRLAFVAIGWERRANSQSFGPSLIVVTNAVRSDGSWASVADGNFQVFEHTEHALSSVVYPFIATPVGSKVPPNLLTAMRRNVVAAVKRGTGPVAISRLLAITIRLVASRNLRVGKDLLILIVPRPSGDTHNRLLMPTHGAAPHLSAMSCYLLPNGSNIPKWTLPNFVTNGSAITDIVYEVNNDGSDSITARIRVRGEKSAGICIASPKEGVEIRAELSADGNLRTVRKRAGLPDEIHGEAVLK
jgi:hypothetical protein